MVIAKGSWIAALTVAGALIAVVGQAVGGEIGRWVRDALTVVGTLYFTDIARNTVCGGATVSAVLANEICERNSRWSDGRRDWFEAWVGTRAPRRRSSAEYISRRGRRRVRW